MKRFPGTDFRHSDAMWRLCRVWVGASAGFLHRRFSALPPRSNLKNFMGRYPLGSHSILCNSDHSPHSNSWQLRLSRPCAPAVKLSGAQQSHLRPGHCSNESIHNSWNLALWDLCQGNFPFDRGSRHWLARQQGLIPPLRAPRSTQATASDCP